jgi:ribosomal protein S27AE
MTTNSNVKPPIFCPDCREPKIFAHFKERDIISESNKVMWEHWKCPDCDYFTRLPNLENL